MSRRAGPPQARLVRGPRRGHFVAFGDRPIYPSGEGLT